MEDNQEKKEGTKSRSRLYPRYDLEMSIEFIGAISKLGGNKVSQEAVAAQVGKAINNSAFIGRISSSKQFGLISQEGGKLSLTSIGKEIIFPRGEAEKNKAIKGAFSAPTLYRLLIDAFNGKSIPDNKTLGNRLIHDYGIEASAKDVASRNFIRSAEYAGALNNGILVMADAEGVVVDGTVGEFETKDVVSNRPKLSVEEITNDKQFIFDFPGGIKLFIPRDEWASEVIADGGLKNVRTGLSDVANKIIEAKNKAEKEKEDD